MPFPDNFSARAFDAAQGVDDPEPATAASPADIRAIRAVREASAAFLAVLRANPWRFDSAEGPAWHLTVQEFALWDAGFAAQVREFEREAV